MDQRTDTTGDLRLQPEWYIHLDKQEIIVKGQFSDAWETRRDQIERDIKIRLSDYGKPQKIGRCRIDNDRVFLKRTSIRNDHVQVYLFTDPRPRSPNVCVKIQISSLSKDYAVYESFVLTLDEILRKHPLPWTFYCAEIAADTTNRSLWEETTRTIPSVPYYFAEEFWYWDDLQPTEQKRQPGFLIPSDTTRTGYYGSAGKDPESLKWYIRPGATETLHTIYRLEWTGHGGRVEHMQIGTFAELIDREESIILSAVPTLGYHPTPQDGTHCAHSPVTIPNADADVTPRPFPSPHHGTNNAYNNTQREEKEEERTKRDTQSADSQGTKKRSKTRDPKQRDSLKASIENPSHVHNAHCQSNKPYAQSDDDTEKLLVSNLDKDCIQDIAFHNIPHFSNSRRPRISFLHSLPNGKSTSDLITKIKFHDTHYSAGRPKKGINPKGKSAQLIAKEFGISTRSVEYLRVILKDSNAEYLFMCGYPITKIHFLLKSGQVKEIVAQEITKAQLYLMQLPDEIRIPLGIDEAPWIPLRHKLRLSFESFPNPRLRPNLNTVPSPLYSGEEHYRRPPGKISGN